MEDGKVTIRRRLDTIRGELTALSHAIHERPEIGFEEFFACEAQTAFLRRHGFNVDVPYGGLETAFRASIHTGDGPRVAFLAEYDALPGYGHACGHNIIAASSVGAGVGLACAMQDAGVPGEVIVMGTPGEEGRHGKLHLVNAGAFDDVDFALMMHPSSRNVIGRGALALQRVAARYLGRAAHSASPEKGVNALTSLIALFNAIDQLRQIWPDTARCTGIISEGGAAPNIIPDLAEGKFCLRAGTLKEVQAMAAGVRCAAANAAGLTGATLEFTAEPGIAERYPNRVMGELFKANMESLGEDMEYPDPLVRVGSSDIGNVSLVVPTIHEYLSIAPGVDGHTHDFRLASASERGDEAASLGAKGLAMTGWDLMTDAAARAAARLEFEKHVAPRRLDRCAG